MLSIKRKLSGGFIFNPYDMAVIKRSFKSIRKTIIPIIYYASQAVGGKQELQEYATRASLAARTAENLNIQYIDKDSTLLIILNDTDRDKYKPKQIYDDIQPDMSNWENRFFVSYVYDIPLIHVTYPVYKGNMLTTSVIICDKIIHGVSPSEIKILSMKLRTEYYLRDCMNLKYGSGMPQQPGTVSIYDYCAILSNKCNWGRKIQ